MNCKKRIRNHVRKLAEGIRRNAGFTLVELLVSVAIFVFMTALLVAKYGNFNQSVLLTNLAYDVALTLRTAQTYGLSVKVENQTFQNSYGVHFSKANNQSVILYSSSDPVYTNGEEVTTYAVKYGGTIGDLCAGNDEDSCTTKPDVLDIAFKRPDPDALICGGVGGTASCSTEYSYAEVTIKSTDGSTRKVSIRRNGQISVKD